MSVPWVLVKITESRGPRERNYYPLIPWPKPDVAREEGAEVTPYVSEEWALD